MTVCPRCGASLALCMQVLVEYRDGAATVDALDTDSFISLTCTGCDLRLEQEPGDGRLRRADMSDPADASYLDAMLARAEHLITNHPGETP